MRHKMASILLKFQEGILALRSMRFVITPPAVSIPRDSGATSTSRTSWSPEFLSPSPTILRLFWGHMLRGEANSSENRRGTSGAGSAQQRQQHETSRRKPTKTQTSLSARIKKSGRYLGTSGFYFRLIRFRVFKLIIRMEWIPKFRDRYIFVLSLLKFHRIRQTSAV